MDYFVLFVLLVFVYYVFKKHYGEVEYVVSKVDGKRYLVRKLPDSQKAADMLAELIVDANTLVKHLLVKYKDKPEAQRLYENFNGNDISEGSPESGYTSYSVNKSAIVLCLRQKDSKNTFADKNVIKYVLFHELAHLMTDSIGHTPEFWENFRFLLTEAIDIGVYEKVDFSSSPATYCGINITSSVV